MIAPTAPVVIAVLAGCLLVAVWHGAAASALFARHGRERWRGWLPVVRDVEFFRWGGRPPHLVPLLLVPVVAVYALVVRGSALARIGRGFGWGAGMAVLGVVLPPVWTTIAAVRTARRGEASAEPDSDTDAPQRARPKRTERPARVRAERTPRVRAARSPRATKASTPSAPVRSPFAPPVDDAPATAYDLLVFAGPRLPLLAERIVIGRAPRSDDPRSQLLPVRDDSGTVSGTHAEIFRIDGTWFVTDLGSRNGVVMVTDAGDVRVAAGASAAISGEFRIGDLRLMVRPRGE